MISHKKGGSKSTQFKDTSTFDPRAESHESAAGELFTRLPVRKFARMQLRLRSLQISRLEFEDRREESLLKRLAQISLRASEQDKEVVQLIRNGVRSRQLGNLQGASSKFAIAASKQKKIKQGEPGARVRKCVKDSVQSRSAKSTVAALTLQRCYKGFIGRSKCIKRWKSFVTELMWSSATLIAMWYRSQVKRIRTKLIQRVFRGHRGRKQFIRRVFYVRRMESSTVIQSVFRGHRGRAAFKEAVKEFTAVRSKASRRLVRAWRCHLARLELDNLRTNKAYTKMCAVLQLVACIRLQRVFSRWIVQLRLSRRMQSARNQLARIACRWAIRRSFVKNALFQRRHDSVITLQSACRQRLQQITYCKNLNIYHLKLVQHAATRLQYAWKLHQANIAYGIREQSVFQKRRKLASLTIGSAWRRHVAIDRVMSLRGCLLNKTLCNSKQTIVRMVVSKFSRSHTRHEQFRTECSIKIQTLFRQFLARKIIRDLQNGIKHKKSLIEIDQNTVNFANMIFCAIKCHLARKALQSAKLSHEEHERKVAASRLANALIQFLGKRRRPCANCMQYRCFPSVSYNPRPPVLPKLETGVKIMDQTRRMQQSKSKVINRANSCRNMPPTRSRQRPAVPAPNGPEDSRKAAPQRSQSSSIRVSGSPSTLSKDASLSRSSFSSQSRRSGLLSASQTFSAKSASTTMLAPPFGKNAPLGKDSLSSTRHESKQLETATSSCTETMSCVSRKDSSTDRMMADMSPLFLCLPCAAKCFVTLPKCCHGSDCRRRGPLIVSFLKDQRKALEAAVSNDIQTGCPDWTLLCSFNFIQSCSMIQGAIRCHFAKRKLKSLAQNRQAVLHFKRDRAAFMIQNAWKMFFARLLLEVKRQRRIRLRSRAIGVIQKHIRSTVTRRHSPLEMARKDKLASIAKLAIQAAILRHCYRARLCSFLAKHRARVLVSNEQLCRAVKCCIAARAFRSFMLNATVLQSSIRRHTWRRMYAYHVQAARSINRLFLQTCARIRFLEKKQSAKVLCSSAAALLLQLKGKRAARLMIQESTRGKLSLYMLAWKARNTFSLSWSALCLSTHLKMLLARTTYIELRKHSINKDACMTIQRCIRCQKSRQTLQQLRKQRAIIVLRSRVQVACLHRKSKDIFRRMQEEYHSGLRKSASAQIARSAVAFFAVRDATHIVLQNRMHENASIIQKNWRSIRSRQQFQQVKQTACIFIEIAAVTVQCRVRMWMAEKCVNELRVLRAKAKIQEWWLAMREKLFLASRLSVLKRARMSKASGVLCRAARCHIARGELRIRSFAHVRLVNAVKQVQKFAKSVSDMVSVKDHQCEQLSAESTSNIAQKRFAQASDAGGQSQVHKQKTKSKKPRSISSGNGSVRSIDTWGSSGRNVPSLPSARKADHRTLLSPPADKLTPRVFNTASPSNSAFENPSQTVNVSVGDWRKVPKLKVSDVRRLGAQEAENGWSESSLETFSTRTARINGSCR